MAIVTAYNIVNAINSLPKNRDYNYINTSNHGLIRIESVRFPAGPIYIKRWNPTSQTKNSPLTVREESISSEMIWRVANAINENEPFNIDRILGSSYNTRAVLESLIAYTSQFYFCYPGRIQDIEGRSTIEHGHKHLIWTPQHPHDNGVLVQKDVQNMAISEIPFKTVVYDNLQLPDAMLNSELDIDVVRRHTQIQIALYIIGLQLGYRTWIAQNDKGIIYQDKPLIEHPGIMSSLSADENVVSMNHAENSAKFIDCIWFQNHRFMPAVMEVEHTTGVTSGLTRMKELRDYIPSFLTRYVIVAPDEDSDKVIEEINRPQFRSLDARFFPYSSVEELYYLCTHRHPIGLTQDFLDSYMKRVLVS